jgi:hypothetical protein
MLRKKKKNGLRQCCRFETSFSDPDPSYLVLLDPDQIFQDISDLVLCRSFWNPQLMCEFLLELQFCCFYRYGIHFMNIKKLMLCTKGAELHSPGLG